MFSSGVCVWMGVGRGRGGHTVKGGGGAIRGGEGWEGGRKRKVSRQTIGRCVSEGRGGAGVGAGTCTQ